MSGWKPMGVRANTTTEKTYNEDISALDAWNPMEEDFNKLSSFAKRSPIDIAKDVTVTKQNGSPSCEKVIYVSYIPENITEDDLNSLFKACGDILSIKIVNKDSFKGYVYCFITFAKAESAFLAVQKFNNLSVGGHKLIVELRSDTAKNRSPIKTRKNNCAVCGQPGKFNCAKCNITFYCSGPCLVSDEPTHSVQCGSLLGTVNKQNMRRSDTENSDASLASRMDNFRINGNSVRARTGTNIVQPEKNKYPQALQTNFIQLESGTLYNLMLMSVTKDNEFYCVINSTESENLLLNLNERLSTMDRKKVCGNIGQGSLVVAPFEGAFYRAVVLKNTSEVEDTVKLLFIDYGNSESVLKSDITYTYDTDIINLTYQAIKCTFADPRDFQTLFKGENDGVELRAVVISQKLRTYTIEPEGKIMSPENRMDNFAQSSNMDSINMSHSMQANTHDEDYINSNRSRFQESDNLIQHKNQRNVSQNDFVNPYGRPGRSYTNDKQNKVNETVRREEVVKQYGMSGRSIKHSYQNRNGVSEGFGNSNHSNVALGNKSSRTILNGNATTERTRDCGSSVVNSMDRSISYNDQTHPPYENMKGISNERGFTSNVVSRANSYQKTSMNQQDYQQIYDDVNYTTNMRNENNSDSRYEQTPKQLSKINNTVCFYANRPSNFFYFPPYFPRGSHMIIQVVSDPIDGYFYAKLHDSFSVKLQELLQMALMKIELRANTENWNANDHCIFVNEANHKCRAKVMHRLVDNSIVLMDVDTGLKHICHPDNLYLPDSSLCQISLNVLHCKLQSTQSTSMIKQFYRDQTVLNCQIVDVEDVSGIKYKLEILSKNKEALIDLSGSSREGISIGAQVKQHSELPQRHCESSNLVALSSGSRSDQSNDCVFREKLQNNNDLIVPFNLPFRERDIPVGTYFKAIICHYNGIDDFYVHLLNNDSLVKLTSISKELAQVKFDDSLQHSVMHSGMAVLAKCKEQKSWERGVVMCDSGTIVSVFFIDYGIKENLSRNFISAISENLLKEPPVAIHVCLKGWELLSKTEERDLIDVYCLNKKNAVVQITFMEYNEGKYTVKLG